MTSKHKILIVFICSTFLCAYKVQKSDHTENAFLPVHSAMRYENETYKDALSRYLERLNIENQKLPKTLRQKKITQFPSGSAIDQAKPLREIDYSMVPLVDSYTELVEIFNTIRDDRSILKDNLNNSRTISWLYPTDGCFARAAVGYLVAEKKNFALPKKIFAFGDLSLQTPYPDPRFPNPEKLPRGATKVTWMYHVALILGVNDPSNGTKNYYVLDPSAQPYAPLPVKTWFSRIKGSSAQLLASLCESNTYVPTDECLDPVKTDANEQGVIDEENNDKNKVFCQQNGKNDVTGFLCLEKQGLDGLGLTNYDPLGTNPPWTFFQLPDNDTYTISIRGGTIPIAAKNLYKNTITKRSDGLSVIQKQDNLSFDAGTCTPQTGSIDSCQFQLSYHGGTFSTNIPIILSDGYTIRYIFIDLVAP